MTSSGGIKPPKPPNCNCGANPYSDPIHRRWCALAKWWEQHREQYMEALRGR